MIKILAGFFSKILLLRNNPKGYIFGFIVIFFLLQNFYYSSKGTFVEYYLIDKITVGVSAFLINQIQPGKRVIANEDKLTSPTTSLSILNGCEGVESMLLLLAAILWLPNIFKYKLLGIFVSVGIIYVLNQIRIIVLFNSLDQDRFLFDVLHGYIAPGIMVLLSFIVFFAYTRMTVVK